MVNQKTELERYIDKTSEGEFLYELTNSYELSPIVSKNILQTAKSCLLQSGLLQAGQVEYHCVGIDEKSGRQMTEMSKKEVVLTLRDEIDDIETLASAGGTSLRQNRIQRICEEALEQDGILSQEDLSLLLDVSTRTIKRDLQEIRRRGVSVITRGTYHNIGRGQTHKTLIIGLYLDGFTYSDIHRKTRHSTASIKRYLESFGKVLMSIDYGITDNTEIRSVTGLSEYLIGQYKAIIKSASKNKIRTENLQMLKQQLSYRYGSKKTIVYDGLRAEAMTGGLK
jgi:biotin operon repressor